jgi:hypothetical protein
MAQEQERRKKVIKENTYSEVLEVIVAELKDRQSVVLGQLIYAGEEFQQLQGRAQELKGLLDYIDGCLKIKEE